MLTENELELILMLIEDLQQEEDYEDAYTEDQRNTIDSIIKKIEPKLS